MRVFRRSTQTSIGYDAANNEKNNTQKVYSTFWRFTPPTKVFYTALFSMLTVCLGAVPPPLGKAIFKLSSTIDSNNRSLVTTLHTLSFLAWSFLRLITICYILDLHYQLWLLINVYKLFFGATWFWVLVFIFCLFFFFFVYFLVFFCFCFRLVVWAFLGKGKMFKNVTNNLLAYAKMM